MSTKIYTAYRVPKSVDILKLLKEAKEIATDYIAHDEAYLKVVHSTVMYQIAKKIQKDPDNIAYKSAIEGNKKGKLDVFILIQILEENKSSVDKSVSTQMSCSVFYDDDYWYLKFFINENSHYKILDIFENQLKFEDYHYQNQADPPKDIDYDEYEKRDKKWDELTASSGGNYLDGFQYDVFGPEHLKKLLQKNWYTGEKDLYKHLAYKFDMVYFKDIE